MQKVVLATGNAGKVRELASLLSDFGLDIVAQTDPVSYTHLTLPTILLV